MAGLSQKFERVHMNYLIYKLRINELEEPVEHVVADLGPWPACLPSFRAANDGSPFNIARNMNMRLSGGYAACAAKGSE